MTQSNIKCNKNQSTDVYRRQLGFSVVKFERLDGNRVYFSEVDILDETPLFDIKPCVTHFDYRKKMCCGWYDEHFKNGETPKRTILK